MLEEISKITERTHLQPLDPHHSSCLTACLHAPRPLQGSSRGTLLAAALESVALAKGQSLDVAPGDANSAVPGSRTDVAFRSLSDRRV